MRSLADKRSSLFIDDCLAIIHTRLFDAVHKLRSPTSNRRFWADAICINQDDYAEKNGQVRIMGKISWTANSVVVYLGNPTEYTDEGMRLLQYFTDTNRELADVPWEHIARLETENCLADIYQIALGSNVYGRFRRRR
jgi:hypothetical protein